jgi:FAD/FMN-containing dehydrogenase
MLDQRPVALALPRDEAEVIAAVEYAREHGLRIAPQATGHNAGPLGALEQTMIIHTSRLQQVAVDVCAQRVRVGAGVKWESVVPRISEHGLAGLHGSSPDVGIAGYSVGGGMGWLARKHGLQANSVTAIELVTADGRLVRTDAEHEPDLFWALRGGGGNFGVVTAIEFAVYPIEELYAGAMFFPFDRAREVLHAWRESLATYPDELMTWASLLQFPDLPDVPEPVRGRSFTVVMGVHQGEEHEGRELLAPIRALGPVMDTFAMVPPAGIAELAMDPPDPLPYTTAHQLLAELPASAIDAIVDAAGPGTGSPLAMVQLRHMGGALARTAPGAGARATLPGVVSLFALGVTGDAESTEVAEGYLGEVERAVLAHRAGDYPNFVEEEVDASRFFDGATWARLRAVKAAYDGDDLFRGNHHVPPAASAG